MFMDSGKVVVVIGLQTPFITSREELKIDETKNRWEKLISQFWRVTH